MTSDVIQQSGALRCAQVDEMVTELRKYDFRFELEDIFYISKKCAWNNY